MDDWKYDKNLNVWFIHVSIEIECDSPYFPRKSQWYIVAESVYPKGKIKVYPDVKHSISSTLNHQSNNSQIEKNGLWRKGALCLDVNTITTDYSEPCSIDYRLIFHLKRAIMWLRLAAKDKLVQNNEPFELPDFITSKSSDIQFAFSEDSISYMQWESFEYKYGIAELDVYKRNPSVYYVKAFKSLKNGYVNYTSWGEYLSSPQNSNSLIAPWILLKKIPVVNNWQAPVTIRELKIACKNQKIDLMAILKNIVPKIRDNKQHLLLVGFPIPRVSNGENEIIFWEAMVLPVLSNGVLTANGFRTNEKGWWMRDKREILSSQKQIKWIISENWNHHEISQRGKMDDLLLRKRVLFIGAGCLGASIAELFVRAGAYNITIADLDVFEVGNLSRHVLDLNNIGEYKAVSVCDYLNSLNPHAYVKSIVDKLFIDDNNKPNIDLDKYDVIIDCTGENSVLNILRNIHVNRTHIMASVSVGLGVKRLYITLMNSKIFDFSSFIKLVTPYLQEEENLFDDYDLPRDGIGCWHPTFPGRSDDVWMAAATSAKTIENYIVSESQKTLSLVYEQKVKDGIFEGYVLVEKTEEE